ncbi:hypothetical protein Avbf_06676 [Armadillidium vulgare]|nr:hypothetical protein Avbf_06676 [Armadillidium vulgare]
MDLKIETEIKNECLENINNDRTNDHSLNSSLRLEEIQEKNYFANIDVKNEFEIKEESSDTGVEDGIKEESSDIGVEGYIKEESSDIVVENAVNDKFFGPSLGEDENQVWTRYFFYNRSI